jgi:hypothetical protein
MQASAVSNEGLSPVMMLLAAVTLGELSLGPHVTKAAPNNP